MFLNQGFEAEGEVRFVGAEIGGQLNCSGAKLKNAGGMALFCDGAKVTGAVFLQEGFEAEGEVRFPDAEIGGALACNGAKLKNAGGTVLVCDSAKVTGAVLLCEGFEAEGEVRFPGAEIGQLACRGAKLKNAGGMALVCDGAKVTGDVFLVEDFEAEGEVRFPGAEIGGNLECDGAKFKNADGVALNCGGANVTGDVFLRGGFEAEGEVRFTVAEIGADFGCIGGSFKNAKAAPSADKSEPPFAEDAINLVGATIEGTLWLGPAAPPNHQQVTIEGSINLQGAHAFQLVDDRQSWPVAEIAVASDKLPCHIHLDGFTYDRFAGGDKNGLADAGGLADAAAALAFGQGIPAAAFRAAYQSAARDGTRWRCTAHCDVQGMPAPQAEGFSETAFRMERQFAVGALLRLWLPPAPADRGAARAVARLRVSVSGGRGAWRLRAEGWAGLDERDL